MLKKYIISIFLLSIHFITSAQKPQAYYIRSSNTIPNIRDYGVPAESESVADSYRIIASDSAEQGSFTVKDYYPNGKIKMIGRSKINDPYVRLDGVCLGFFQNGKRKFIESFKDGVITGDVIKYYPNGKVYTIGSWDGKWHFFLNECHDTTGLAIAENGKGRWIKFDEDFKKINGEGPVANGVENGEWNGRLNDTITYNCTYNNGEATKGTSKATSGKIYTFEKGVTSAEFMGGLEAFGKHLARNIRYPAVAREKNIQGKVFVSFVVDPLGGISNLHVIKGVGGGCDEETLRVIQLSSGNWQPGTSFGVPVRSEYTVPISFTLAKD